MSNSAQRAKERLQKDIGLPEEQENRIEMEAEESLSALVDRLTKCGLSQDRPHSRLFCWDAEGNGWIETSATLIETINEMLQEAEIDRLKQQLALTQQQLAEAQASNANYRQYLADLAEDGK